MARKEFSKSTKAKAAERCTGKCEGCGKALRVGEYHYDHIIPDGLGGEPTIENCQVLCTPCHKVKTHEQDNPIMQKADRQRKHVAQNIKAPKARIPSPPKAPKPPGKALPPRRSIYENIA